MKRNGRIAMGGLLWTCLVAAGDIPAPPRWDKEEITVQPTVKRDLVRECRLGEYIARFEETMLHGLRNNLGVGDVKRTGDAASSIEWLCYSLPGQLVWFVSSAVGGGTLTEVAAETIDPSDPRQQLCSPIPDAFRPLSLEFGWIGSEEGAVRKALGTPSGVQGNREIYFFTGKEAGSYQSPDDPEPRQVAYDVSAYIEIEFDNGKVTMVHASHVTSY